MSQQADWHEDRDSAWLLGLADALASEWGVDRGEALARMAAVFGGAATGTGVHSVAGTSTASTSWTASPFRAARTIVDLARAGELCERLAAPTAAVEMTRAGAPTLFDPFDSPGLAQGKLGAD